MLRDGDGKHDGEKDDLPSSAFLLVFFLLFLVKRMNWCCHIPSDP